MSRRAFASITSLSARTNQPVMVSKAMHNLLTVSLKLVRRVQTVNVLKKLLNANVGTNEVEQWNRVIKSQSNRKVDDKFLVQYVMRYKVQDAEWMERKVQREYLCVKRKRRKV